MPVSLFAAALAVAAAPVFDTACLAAVRPAPDELTEVPHCAAVVQGVPRWNPAVLRRFVFDARGLAGVALAGEGWRWVRPDARSAPVLTYDNGPDEFVSGLARGMLNGGIAYYDRRLGLALATPYEWAEPFEDGLAVVCQGCAPRAHGEHTLMAGGKWGAIDRSGRLVVPLRDDAASARREAQAARHGARPQPAAPRRPHLAGRT